MEEIVRYFPNLTPQQVEQFTTLKSLYELWNARINVISRKDMDQFYVHHVLHSLAIAKFTTWRAGTKVMDVGTGGGFPGIPLAIFYPEVTFHLVDSIGKKIKVVEAVVESLALTNVTAQQIRMEEQKHQYDFIVTRAVASFPKLVAWTRKSISGNHHNPLPNGIIALKGGDIKTELQEVPGKHQLDYEAISRYYDDPWFEHKYVVYWQR